MKCEICKENDKFLNHILIGLCIYKVCGDCFLEICGLIEDLKKEKAEEED